MHLRNRRGLTSPIIAFILSFIATEHAVQSHSSSQDSVHCYESVKSLSNSTSKANCFTVSPSGLFSKLFNDVQERKRENGKGRNTGYVIPGLWDGHGHLLQYGELLQSVNLFESKSMDDAVSKVKNYAAKNPSAGSYSEWIRGIGWDQAIFGRMPTAVRTFT